MLFRKPVKGNYIRFDRTGTVIPILDDWDDLTFEQLKDSYSFVEVTPVDLPENEGNYYNLYKSTSGKVYFGGIAGYRTRKVADSMADATRVACIDLNQFEGRYDA